MWARKTVTCLWRFLAHANSALTCEGDVAVSPLEPEGDVGDAGEDWWRRIFQACVMVSATWMFVLTGERRRRPTQCRAPQRPCWL